MIRFLNIPYLLRIALSLLCLLSLRPAEAQVISWPNPEVEALYNSAQASLSSGNLKQAIASYQQAIALAPGQVILYRDLANAFLRSGDPVRAEQTIAPLIDGKQADAIGYAIAANAQIALKEEKKARRLLDKGIENFPHSGYLYHERGKIYEEKGDMIQALKEWVGGMTAEPGYHLNYYEAARTFMRTTRPVRAIIYGEIFVNLERSTPRSGETRKMLLAAYRRFYATPDLVHEQRFGKERPAGAPGSFEDAVSQTLLKLAPVVADGINTENLTMLRTRFSMEWMAAYSAKYPFTLFRMHDDLLRAGHFDAYCQWLFGRAENTAQYDAWVKFHPEAIPGYEAYYRLHPLQPTASDAYSQDISKRIFPEEDNQYKR